MPKQYNAPPPMSIDPNAKITATMHTSSGAIVFELFASEAPNTVNNFVFLAREGFYDGVIFHRIIKGFMCQSGDPEGTGMGGPGYSFADEPVTRDYLPGTLAMANAGPNTNGSQFFVVHQAGRPPQELHHLRTGRGGPGRCGRPGEHRRHYVQHGGALKARRAADHRAH